MSSCDLLGVIKLPGGFHFCQYPACFRDMRTTHGLARISSLIECKRPFHCRPFLVRPSQSILHRASIVKTSLLSEAPSPCSRVDHVDASTESKVQNLILSPPRVVIVFSYLNSSCLMKYRKAIGRMTGLAVHRKYTSCCNCWLYPLPYHGSSVEYHPSWYVMLDEHIETSRACRRLIKRSMPIETFVRTKSINLVRGQRFEK